MTLDELKTKLLNLNVKGIAMFVPFIKQIVCEDLKTYNAIDGYQAAILSMNFNPYIKLSNMNPSEINPSDSGFLDSFNIIIADQKDLLVKSYEEFEVLVNKYLTSPDEAIDKDKFKNSMFIKP